MAKGLLITFSKQEILAIRAECLKNLTSNTVVTSWSDSGTSVGKQLTMDTERLLDEVNYALQTRWPAEFGYKSRHLASDLSQQDFN